MTHPSGDLPELDAAHPSELFLTIAAPGLPEVIRKDFEGMVTLCHTVFRGLTHEAGMPPKLEVVLAEDFEEVVNARSPSRGPNDKYCAQRPLSSVWGINLAQDDKWDHVVIVFSAREFANHHARMEKEKLNEIAVVGHEMAHSPLARIRIASGRSWALDRRTTFPATRAENMALGLLDEYLADRAADLLVGAICTSTDVAGQQRKSRVWDTRGDSYFGMLYEYLETSFPELTGVVMKYKFGLVGLDEMWGKVLGTTSHLFTMFIHAQAYADSVPFEILENAAFKELPMVRLYLADTLPPFLGAVRKTGFFCSSAAWKTRDEEALSAGKKAILEFWMRLGLTFRETVPESDQFHIDVGLPIL